MSIVKQEAAKRAKQSKEPLEKSYKSGDRTYGPSPREAIVNILIRTTNQILEANTLWGSVTAAAKSHNAERDNKVWKNLETAHDLIVAAIYAIDPDTRPDAGDDGS